MVKKKSTTAAPGKKNAGRAKYPRHSVSKALRIPAAIMEQNAGKECPERDSARYVGVGFNGPYRVEISSAIKYGFLERPRSGFITVTERARRALRPQKPNDEVDALREAVLEAPEISDVYKHYRGENLPDRQFFEHTLTDRFHIPADKVSEFNDVLIASLEAAKLVDKVGDKVRVLDISPGVAVASNKPQQDRVPGALDIESGDSCFVIMPFATPIGSYYEQLLEPGIKKAGLNPVRADADIFGTGKIMDQVWRGIKNARVLVAVLTGRNPNVLYELGLAHALDKPVVLISATEQDVPFDLHHIRVIYYEVNDPFWGQKLIDKVAENIVSAVKNPEEAVFKAILVSPE
jgi:hypothetical protein